MNDKIFSLTFFDMEERQIPWSIGRQVEEINKKIIIEAIKEKDLSSGIINDIKADDI